MANYHCACGAVYNNESERLECARAHPKPTTVDKLPALDRFTEYTALDHPCRQTCSGWAQGAASRDEEVGALVSLLSEWFSDDYDGAELLVRTGEALKRHRGEK